MATASKTEIELFNVPKFDPGKYKKYYTEDRSNGMTKLLAKPINQVLRPEFEKQRRLVKDTATSIRKRVAPSVFDLSGPESFKKIVERYNDNSRIRV